MPRTSRSTGGDYTPRPPQPHPDARRHAGPPATRVAEAPSADAGAPFTYLIARHTHVPGGVAVQWVRRVDRVQQNAHSIRMFEGDYHQLRDGRISARSGSLFLICVKDRRAVERIYVYIYLPDDIWYDTGIPPIVRGQGWHRILRNYVDGWTVLSRVQRVIRACTEGQLAMQAELHQMAMLTTHGAAPDPEIGATFVQALAHFRDIANQATGDITELTNDSIRRAFRAWATNVAESTSTDYDAVVAALSDSLAEPTPHTGGDLSDQLSELASWLPDEHGERLAENELEIVLQVCDNVRQYVADEQHTRTWQFNVLRELGMPGRQAREAMQDRSLTEIFMSQNHMTAVSYLDHYYDFGSTTAADVKQVLTRIANEGEAKRRQQPPSVENRLARNIRLGRKRNA